MSVGVCVCVFLSSYQYMQQEKFVIPQHLNLKFSATSAVSQRSVSVCVCVRVCVYIYIYMYTYTIHIYTCARTHACTHTRTHARTYWEGETSTVHTRTATLVYTQNTYYTHAVQCSPKIHTRGHIYDKIQRTNRTP
jgi:hypothetical protein